MAIALPCARPCVGAIDIDTFDVTSQIVIVTGAPAGFKSDADFAAFAPGEAIGNERDIYVERTSATFNTVSSSVSSGAFVYSLDSGATGNTLLAWDGLDASTTVDHTGLGGVDLTEAGINTGILLRVFADIGTSATLTLFTNATNFSQAAILLPAGTDPQDVFVPFATFVIGGGTGVDPTDVGAITLLINGLSNVDVLLESVQATCALTPCPSPTSTATATATPTASPTPSSTPTNTPTATATATSSATQTASATPSASPSSTPGLPILQISKTTEPSVKPGATLVYAIEFANAGNATASGVVITETVPIATRFAAAASSPGWSCADGSPAGTICSHAVPDLAPGAMGTLLFGVIVDQEPSTAQVINSIRISDSQDNSGTGSAVTSIDATVPVPALTPFGLVAALAALAALARRRIGG